MRFVGSSQHKERVEAVIEIIKAVTGQETISGDFLSKLNAMSFEELGHLVMNYAADGDADKRPGPVQGDARASLPIAPASSLH